MSNKDDQQELFQAETSWFHMFKEIIRSKTWANMTPIAKSLYPVIKSFVNWKTGCSFPSVDTLVEYSGLSKPSVFKGLNELEELGYIRTVKNPGKKTQYTLIEKFQIGDSATGDTVASASFDYLPSIVTDAMIELKNYVSKGLDENGQLQIITVEKFIIENLTIINGNNNIGTQNNTIDGSAMLKGMHDIMNGNLDTEEAILVRKMDEKNKEGKK